MRNRKHLSKLQPSYCQKISAEIVNRKNISELTKIDFGLTAMYRISYQ